MKRQAWLMAACITYAGVIVRRLLSVRQQLALNSAVHVLTAWLTGAPATLFIGKHALLHQSSPCCLWLTQMLAYGTESCASCLGVTSRCTCPCCFPRSALCCCCRQRRVPQQLPQRFVVFDTVIGLRLFLRCTGSGNAHSRQAKVPAADV